MFGATDISIYGVMVPTESYHMLQVGLAKPVVPVPVKPVAPYVLDVLNNVGSIYAPGAVTLPLVCDNESLAKYHATINALAGKTLVTLPMQATVCDVAPVALMLIFSLYVPTTKPDFKRTYTITDDTDPAVCANVTIDPKPLPEVVDTS